MATLDTYGLRTALEISKRCDSLCDNLAALRTSATATFSADVMVGANSFVMDLPREALENELLDKLNNAKGELQAMGVTYAEISK